MNYWINNMGNFHPCSTHKKFAIERMKKIVWINKEKGIDIYSYEYLESAGWKRIKITKSELVFIGFDLSDLNEKQKRAIKNYCLLKNKTIREDLYERNEKKISKKSM